VQALRPHLAGAFFAIATLGLLGGLGARLAGLPDLADGVWLAVTLLGLAQSAVATAVALRHRRASVDVIALLALAGALVVGEAFAGAVITVMLASGILLEARAAARARRELSLLVEGAPRTARPTCDRGLGASRHGSAVGTGVGGHLWNPRGGCPARGGVR